MRDISGTVAIMCKNLGFLSTTPILGDSLHPESYLEFDWLLGVPRSSIYLVISSIYSVIRR